MIEIKISKASNKFLQKLGSNKFAKQIALKIRQLSANGHLNDCKLLKGVLSGYYRTDVGEFRIIYKIENNCLLISLVDKRNDNKIYKLMKNKT